MKRQANGFATEARGTFFIVESYESWGMAGEWQQQGCYCTRTDAVARAHELHAADEDACIRVVEQVGVVWRNFE